MSMYGYQCRKCNGFWASHAHPEQGHQAITKWCPLCLPLIFPPDPRTLSRGVV